MSDKNCDLNTSGPLRESNAGYKGASGDGNKPSMETLKAGFEKLPDPTSPFWRLPGNDLPVMAEDGGFAGRPHGWER